jgi:UDP-N-acetylmuramate: L-alanyl-gamma-D-glutamyl-meso-diaminopimelate ligase
VVVNAWSGHALAATRDATAPVVTVGSDPGCDLVLSSWEPSPEGGRAALSWRRESMELSLPLTGYHNAQNASIALAAALTIGLPPTPALAALARFPGVARRMETRGQAAGITVVDDFAHHPTAVGVTIAAAHQRWPARRIVVAFEPRSLTAARRDFGAAYLEALSRADLVLVAAPFHSDRLAEDEILDREGLARDLEARGVYSLMPSPGADAVEVLLPHLEPGDVVLGCSSGSFDGFHLRLLEALAARN